MVVQHLQDASGCQTAAGLVETGDCVSGKAADQISQAFTQVTAQFLRFTVLIGLNRLFSRIECRINTFPFLAVA